MNDDLEERGHGLEILFLYLYGGTEKNHKDLNQDRRCVAEIRIKHLLNTSVKHSY